MCGPRKDVTWYVMEFGWIRILVRRPGSSTTAHGATTCCPKKFHLKHGACNHAKGVFAKEIFRGSKGLLKARTGAAASLWNLLKDTVRYSCAATCKGWRVQTFGWTHSPRKQKIAQPRRKIPKQKCPKPTFFTNYHDVACRMALPMRNTHIRLWSKVLITPLDGRLLLPCFCSIIFIYCSC